jgi:transmembrane sensor
MTEDRNSEPWAASEREGLRWVDLLTSGLATAADLKALQRWRDKSPDHAKALREAIALRRVSTGLRPEDVGVDISQTVYAFGSRSSSVSRRAILGTGVATAAIAATACYAVVNPPLNLWPSLADLSADYRTAKGEQRNIVLADVAITLNTMTSLSDGSDGKRRAIKLIDGEVSVATAFKGGNRFEVLAMGGSAVASSAKFDVRCDGSSVRVICSEGVVQVRNGPHSATVSPGQKVSYKSSTMNPVTPADLATETAWRKGLLVLSGTSLKDAVAEINRYRAGRIIIANTDLERRQIDLLLSIKQLDNAIPLIRRATGARVTAVGDYVVLT